MDREKQILDADHLAHALARVQKEVTGLDDASSSDDENELHNDSEEITRLESLSSDHVADSSHEELSHKLDSAKKVMELLARMRPQVQSAAQETAANVDTPYDQNGLGQNDVAPLLDHDAPGIGKLSEQDIPGTIGRFEIKSLLGQGGFGLVFKAHDPELDRMVALKVPTFDSLIKADAQARFKQEGRVVAALSHPNIVPVFEVGNEGPISFIASELIEGTDLSKWILEHGPCHPMLAAKTITTIADAVQHAHIRHVLHRDLKPANVLLATKSDAADFDPALIRVTDFGLAKFVTDKDAALTRTGSLMGTPAYSAPEQLESGGSENLTDSSADVYSLGAIMYFLLTGRPPLEAAGILELVQKVQSQDPVPPHKLRSEVPLDLSAICMMALEKSPTDRYASAHAMQVDLQRFIDGEPVIARPVRITQRAAKWCRRNPLVAMMLATTLATILLGSVASLWSARNARIAAQESRRQYLDSKQVVDDSYVQISRNPMFLSSSFREQKLELLESAKKQYVAFLADNANDQDLLVDLIRTHVYIAAAESGGDNLQQARKGFADSLEMTESALQDSTLENDVLTELKLIQARCLTGLSEVDRKLGNNDDLLANLTEAAEIYETNWPDQSADQDVVFDMISTYQAFVNYHRGQNEPDKANDYSVKQQMLLELIASEQELNSTLKNHYAMSLGDQSIYQRRAGKLDFSLQLLDQSIEISQELIDNEPNPVWFVEIAAGSYYRRGVVYARSGKMDLATDDANQCLKLFESIRIHNRTAEFADQLSRAKNLLAVCLQNTNQSSLALALFEENLSDAKGLVESYPDRIEFRVSLAEKLFGLASAYIDDLQLEKAGLLTEELAAALQGMQQDEVRDPNVAQLEIFTFITKGRLRLSQQDIEESIKCFDKAMDLVDQSLTKESKSPTALGNKQAIHDIRAYAYNQLDRFEDAILDRRESQKLDLQRPEYERIALAEALARGGHVEEALEAISTVNPAAAKKELTASRYEMNSAFAYGSIAAELKKQSDLDPENDKLQADLQDQLELAEAHFLRGVELGYFKSDPNRFRSIVLRPHLELLFELPSINPIIEKQRLLWKIR